MSGPTHATGAIVERHDILSPAARALIAQLNAELSGRYPEEGANHFRLDPEEVAEGRGAFLIAWKDGAPVGCGAIRRIEEGTGEIKRMYVVPPERGRGVGRVLVDALEAQARVLGLSRLVLETGVRQREAIALYERAGFSGVAPFGEYVGSPLSVCMAKDLSPVADGGAVPTYRITIGNGRSTEDLVEAGGYGYVHSCIGSDNFPVSAGPRREREITLLSFDHDVTSEEALAAAARQGFERPTYEDALHFGIEYPEVQRDRPVVFLHDPWFGFFGRRDVLCLWDNGGRRELGLEGFDDLWSERHCFAFVRAREAASDTRPA